MGERVVVIGAGMAGLWTAMALAPTGREVILLDRDPPPPDGGPDTAFEDWARRGVGHLRHSHAFLARLRTLIRDEYPELLAALFAAGCRDLTFENSLTPMHRRRYKPQPVDRDLAVLTSRRTTLELVMRRHVEGLAGVSFRPGAFVRELIVEPGETPRVTGVRLEDGEELRADIVVDARGRTSPTVEQLKAAGADIRESGEDSRVIYFTRHYRLRDGREEPPRGRGSSTGNLSYLMFGVFPADNGWFSVTLCLPDIEEEMRKAVIDPAVFDAVCRQLPGVAPWIEPERTEGMSRVFGMGQLHSHWVDFTPDGRPAVHGFFAVGDSLVRTNPLYGRGCSFAGVGAHLLRDALAVTTDPGERLASYTKAAEAELRPYYKVMMAADRDTARRALRKMQPAGRLTLRERMIRSFLQDGVQIAVRTDADLLRAFLRGFHMLEHPQAWLKRPENLFKVLKAWARGKKRNADAYPVIGPERDEMLTAVGVSPTADPQRLGLAA